MRVETIKFELRRYQDSPHVFENDFVGKLPGLLITQASLRGNHRKNEADIVGLRFDFVDDWYNVQVFLDGDNQPTGHYRSDMQTPLRDVDGVWRGDTLLLGLEVLPGFEYYITGEDEFFSAVEQGWMRVHAAAKARETLRRLCHMIENGYLPQEVMDAVGA